MASGFDIEELYDAVVDDDRFAELPATLARQFESRSSIIHWIDTANRSQIDAHSGHFSDAQMADYSTNFAADDLWTQAASGSAYRNRAWNAADLVAESSYGRSRFYNEWIRAMGDDTWHCAGAVMQTRHGLGIVGLHRGKGDKPYDQDLVARLQGTIAHLRRALTIRADIARRIGALSSWSQLFADNPAPCLIIDRHGRLTCANPAADALLRCERLLKRRKDRITPAASHDERRFADLIALATARSAPQSAQAAFGEAPHGIWLAETLPIVSGAWSGAAMVTVTDRSHDRQRAELFDRLRQSYRLTPAETEIALALAEGAGVDEIAGRRSTSGETVRYQIKQILAKTGARRQSELVALVLRVALP